MDHSNLMEPDEIENKPYIFVSYSRKDMASVQNVLKILRDNSFRFWYDKGLKSGTEWAEELGDKIDRCDQFLVLISPNSVKSKYVRKEIRLAIDKDKNMLVLYLEDTNLTSGLHLLLGDIQAIHREDYRDESAFTQALCKAASNNTLYQKSNVFDASGSVRSGAAKAELLENYKLMERIGAGGMSDVYVAEQKRTGSLVAVKCGLLDTSYRGYVVKKSFYMEEDMLKILSYHMCPYTPTVLDWFEDDTQVFLVETLVNGDSLKTSAPYSEEEVVTIAKKVLNILRYLHDNNIVYRDIKPGNLIRDKYGEIHLIDFNTAMYIEGGGQTAEFTLGTIGYAPPEQYNPDGIISFSSDLYALGRTMEHLLYPKFPDIIVNNNVPVRRYRKDISAELEFILEKMTAASQADRYQNVDEVLRELETYKRTNFLKKILHRIQSWGNIRRIERSDRKSTKTGKHASQGVVTTILSSEEKDLEDTTILLMPEESDAI